MSKGCKALLQQNKEVLLAHLISFGILLLGFVLCRYAFFGLHGMKEWPAPLILCCQHNIKGAGLKCFEKFYKFSHYFICRSFQFLACIF